MIDARVLNFYVHRQPTNALRYKVFNPYPANVENMVSS